MTRSTRPGRLLLPLLVVAWLGLAPPRGVAQAPPGAGHGIDLVFLVDVSGSMSLHPITGVRGNDEERIRWDAVMLSLDLLTAEDQVLIIPFNGYAPARVDVPASATAPAQTYKSPGILEERGKENELVSPRSVGGRKLLGKVGSFAHNMNPGPSEAGEWNGDWGPTALLSALDVARERLREAMNRAGPGGRDRPRFIILLTDGQEASPEKPAGLEHLKRYETGLHPERLRDLYKDPILLKWIDHFGEPQPDRPSPRIKVYTIGLGAEKEPDEGILHGIAIKTGGHFDHVTTNGQLIATFRKLIWQLKGYWTKEPKQQTIPPGSAGTEGDLMSGIRDFGALYYQIVPGAGPRDSRKVEGGDDLRFAWFGAGGAARDRVAPLFVSSSSSYNYRHYEHRFSGTDPARFEEDDRLATSWGASASDRRLYFAKRTTRPLFELDEDVIQKTYVRYEAMTIRVKMRTDELPRFQPEQFKLTATIKTAGTADERVLQAPSELQYDPPSRSFQGEVDLPNLHSTGGEADIYTLAIEAEGVGAGQDHALLTYKLQLPPVDIKVENQLRLKLTEATPLMFSNKYGVRRRPIRIRPERNFRLARSVRPIRLRVMPTKWPADERGRETDVVQPDGKPIVLEANDQGMLEAVLYTELRGVNANVLGHFRGGEMVIVPEAADHPRMVRLRVPFEANISKRRLGFNFADLKLEYDPARGEAARSDAILVTFDGAEADDGPPVTVSIPRQNFQDSELWLQRVGDARGQGVQMLLLPRSTDRFQIWFQPKKNRNTTVENQRLGYYSFHLRLTVDAPGYEYDPAAGKVELLYLPPRFVFDAPAPVRLQLRRPRSWSLPIGLEGGVEVGREAILQFRASKTGSLEPPRFKRSDGASDEFIGIEPFESLALTASPKPVKKPLSIRLLAPIDPRVHEKFQCGTYTLENGWIAAELTEPRKLDLTMIVDDLEVRDADDVPIDQTLSFYQVRGRKLVRKIRVYNRLGGMAPDAVDVTEVRHFVNVDRDAEDKGLKVQVVSREVCRDKSGRPGVELGLSPPDLGASFEPYSGEVDIHCRRLELHRNLRCLVERVEVFRPEEPTPAKK